MNILMWSFFIFFLNAIVGAAILSLIDRRRELFYWYKASPGTTFKVLVLSLWPIVIVAYFWPWYPPATSGGNDGNTQQNSTNAADQPSKMIEKTQ